MICTQVRMTPKQINKHERMKETLKQFLRIYYNRNVNYVEMRNFMPAQLAKITKCKSVRFFRQIIRFNIFL